MIFDSFPWKEELRRAANKLERAQSKKKWSERTAFTVEREVMLGAFAIRRLNESRKVSDSLAKRPIPVRLHALTSSPPDIWEVAEPWNHFDLTTSTRENLTLNKFCNQIIHSWSWLVSDEEDGLGIYITSDKDRSHHLYFMTIETIVEVFRKVGRDHIVQMSMKTNKKGERIFYNLISAEDIEARNQSTH
jgi:hypothetical protein